MTFRFDRPDILAPTVGMSDDTPQVAASGLAGADQPLVYSKFETEMWVRPDDIDMYRHVHSSRYLDYVLTARIEQMERCYGIPMSEFQKQGYGWFVASTQLNYQHPLNLGDRFVVRCWIENFTLIGLRVRFEIEHSATKYCCCDGWFDYVMVSLQTSRAVRLPEWIRTKYSI